MKRLFAGIAAVLVTGMAMAGCGEKKTADILTSEAYEEEEDIRRWRKSFPKRH